MAHILLRLFFFCCLVLLLVARASSELQCGQLLNNLNTSHPGTAYGQKYAAQAFSVGLTTQLFSLTLAGVSNGTAEVSICTGTTASFVPLPDASLVIAQEVVQDGRTLYTYNATQPGIVLSPNVTYWVVLNGSSDWQGWLSIASDGRQPSSPVTLLNSFSLYSNASDWRTETDVFGQVGMQGCYAVAASPSPSPSPSAAPAVAPITANVTASFGQEGPAVHLSAPASSSATVAVSANLSAVLVGGTSVPTSELTLSSGVGVTVQNSSSTTQEYSTRLDNSTLLAHQFSFHREATSGEFGGATFPIGAGTVKWSINITTKANDSLVGSDTITLHYLLSDFASSFAQAGSAKVSKRSGFPLANMTTYVLFLSGVSAVAEVEVFDLALFDGVLRPINHSVVVSSSANSSSYVLELTFPGGFNDSLYYDPSLGLGVLLGSADRGGGGDTNVGLIVGVTVGVGVAVLLVSGVIVGSIAVAWWRKKQLHADGVNWGNDEEESAL